MRLAPEERFELLKRYVLPESDRARIRIDFEFAPPASSHGDDHRSPVVSPAFLLVETARALDRLADLRRQVADRVVPDSQRLNRTVLDVLIALEDRDFDSAKNGLTEIFEAASRATVIPAERATEAIAISAAMHYAETAESARDLAFLIYEQARNKRGPRSERWHRYSYAMKHLLQWRAEKDKTTTDTANVLPSLATALSFGSEKEQWPLANWHPVSRMTAETTGDGYPTAAWSFKDGQVGHVTCHDHDYLYYRIPLAGNFDIEAELTTFGYRDIHLAIGGVYAGPGYDLKGCLHGNFRHDSRTIPITPALTEVQDWMCVRIRVRDGIRTTFINGREVFRYAHTGDPWLAIHSPWYTNGSVRNLRISGDITVPEEINLLTHPDLTGWLTYYNEVAGGTYGDWQLRGDLSSRRPLKEDASDTVGIIQPVELIGRRSQAPVDSFTESLLCYHRPVLENGIISYEFYYEPGVSNVSPAVGRLAYLIDEDGLREHRITDGLYERQGLSPLPDNDRLLSDSLPLITSHWNRVTLQFIGSAVLLQLNGQMVHQTGLHNSDERRFGLFHYSDHTEARIRHLRWRGDWPLNVPAIKQQELAGDEVDTINDELTRLPAKFTYDFSNGLDSHLFSVMGKNWQQQIEKTATGLRVTQPGSEGYPNIAIVPQLQVHGDFDIIAAFENFEMTFDAPGDANLQLFAGLSDKDSNECRLYRRCESTASRTTKQQLQASLFTGPTNQRRYLFFDHVAEEARSGRLRLARRGDTVHYMFAELDSPFFRLITSRKTSEAITTEAGIRLLIETQRSGTSNVTWKTLSIRAESLTGPATLPRQSVAELNFSREQLKAKQHFDFTRLDSLEQFVVWGDKSRFEHTSTGLLVTAPGTSDWQATGLASRLHIAGDFDVELTFDVIKLDDPASKHDSNLYIEADFNDAAKASVKIKMARYPERLTAVVTGVRQQNRNGNREYREVSATPVTSANHLRIARRGSVASLIYREAGTEKDVVAATIEIGTSPLPAVCLRTLIHTGGADRETVVQFKSFSIHAEQLRIDTHKDN